MSQLTKACIALTDGLLYEDISDESGFKDAALNDADRPYLDNHLFLMYDVTTISDALRKKLDNLKWVFDQTLRNNNGNTYIVYTISLNKNQKNLLRMPYADGSNGAKIVSFYYGRDTKLVNRVMNHEYLNDDGESIPLETNVSDGNDFAREIQEK